MKKQLILLLAWCLSLCAWSAVDLTQCRILVSDTEAALVKKMAVVLSEDIERVISVRPSVVNAAWDGPMLVLATAEGMKEIGSGTK